MSYSYDRTAAKSDRPLTSLSMKNLINSALSEYGAAFDGHYNFKQTGDTTFEVRGVARDGRTFSGPGRLYLKGEMIHVEADIEVVGEVDMGPVPDFLEEAEARTKTAIQVLVKAIDEPKLERRLLRAFKWVLESIEEWRAGRPVDKKVLRSYLRDAAEDMGKRSLDAPHGSPEREATDQARKALSGAARKLK